MPPVRVVNLAHPEYHGLSAIGPPGSREAAAERLLTDLHEQGYELVGLAGELAVLRHAAAAGAAAA